VFDDHLVRYCSGNPNDIEAMIDTLDALGFETIAESDGQPCWQDCCVVDHFGRATLPCGWLQLAGTIAAPSSRHGAGRGCRLNVLNPLSQ
jgi:hypothetical protein